MQPFVRQLLTNREVNNNLSYGEMRHARSGSNRSGGSAQAGTRENRAEHLMAAQQYTIAVVDDDPSMLKALGRLLLESGYGVELFATFGDVLKHIPSSNAICILIDCQLGQYSGIELARQLTASRSGLPIVFMTACDDDYVRQQAMAIGCIGFLRKPFYLNQLLELISKATPNTSTPNVPL
jgi:FixJ family two-component response regulator